MAPIAVSTNDHERFPAPPSAGSRDSIQNVPMDGPIDVERAVTEALRRRLPGACAHVRLGIEPRPGWLPGHLPDDCHRAAGLVILRFPGPDVILTERAAGLARHGGQIALPGGRVEEGEDLLAAALREAAEEIGLDPATARPVGPLTPIHIPVSGFVLHPFVAATEQSGWQPDRREVARVFAIPLEQFADPRCLVVEDWTYEGRAYRVPLFDLPGAKVWGATAMILAELLCALGWLEPAGAE
jgi:8-oxo-dGTP pyrophosphatase MutT (NUDIX family)